MKTTKNNLIFRFKFLSITLLVLGILFSCSSEDSEEETTEEKTKAEVPQSKPTVVKPKVEKPDSVKPDPIKPDPVDPKPELEGLKYISDAIIFEPEITKSDLGKWVLRSKGDPAYYDGGAIKPFNDSYLEFTGNNLNSGPPTSPLKYTFECKKTGTYRLVARMYQPLKPSEHEDKRNDVYISLAGNFTSANAYPTKTLKKLHKIFGRGVRKWGGLRILEAHVDGKALKAKVLYNLTKGEKYTLTVAGRAQGCSIDYFILYDTKLGIDLLGHDDPAVVFPESFRPDIKVTTEEM